MVISVWINFPFLNVNQLKFCPGLFNFKIYRFGNVVINSSSLIEV